MSALPDLEIFVVSLAANRPRRDYIRRHLSELGLDFELHDAVDGHHVPRELRGSYGDVEARARLGRDLLPGEIGCAMSHLNILRLIVERRIPEALVLEDDAVLDAETVELLRHRDRLQEDREIVLLNHHSRDGAAHRGAETSLWGRVPISGRFSSGRFVEHAWSSVAYLVRRSGAQKILQVAHPIWCPIDQLTGAHHPAGLRVYGITPRCVGEADLPSTMAGRDAAQQQLRADRRRSSPLRRTLSRWAGRTGYGTLKRRLVIAGRKLVPPQTWD